MTSVLNAHRTYHMLWGAPQDSSMVAKIRSNKRKLPSAGVIYILRDSEFPDKYALNVTSFVA